MTTSHHSTVRDSVRKMRTVLALVPWRMRGRVILLLAAAFLAALLDLAAVLAMLPLMEMLTTTGDIPSSVRRLVVPLLGTDDRLTLLLAITLFIGLGFLVKNVSLIVIRWWSIGVMNRASAAAQATLLDRYAHATYASHRLRSRSVILQTITGAVPMTFAAVLLGGIALIVDLMTVVLLFASLLVLSPAASLVALVLFGGTALLLSRVFKPWAHRFANHVLRLNTAMWSSLGPAIEGFRETRLFGREALFTADFAENRRRAAGVARSQSMLNELPKYLLEIVMILGIILIAMFLFATRDEATAIGLLAVFAAAAMRVVPALNRAVATVNGIRAGQPSLDLLVEQVAGLAESDSRSPVPASAGEETVTGDIVVRDLGFRFPDAHSDVLDGVDVTIRSGSTVAVVGASGAGKTTFVDLLVGLFTPTRGTICVGGIDIADDPERWRRSVAMVSQRVFLWDASVRDLITFGEPLQTVDEDLLEDVIDRAHLRSLVEGMADGLDTRVGDGGARLSGGQAQRIGIARALYGQPSVLVLDEATSALDNETEHQITSTIAALRGKVTVVVVAHRLSTVKDADVILFFSRGRLRATGSMAQLRAEEPEFARMVALGSIA